MKARTRQRKYLREAAITLALAKVAVHLLPAATILSWARKPPRRIMRFDVDAVEWTRTSIERMAKSRLINALCLPQALAAQLMLRRRGIASRLCLGVARHANDSSLSAHAWLEVGQGAVVGGQGAIGFTRLVEFSGAPGRLPGS